MLSLMLALLAPALALTPAGAAWSSAGVSVGAGAALYVPGAYGYMAAEQALHRPECGEFPDCEGYGFALLLRGGAVGGPVAYGLGAAGAGALTHHLTTRQGAGKVLLACGATALVSSGLIATGMLLGRDEESGPSLGLVFTGMAGNLVGVPLAVGLASGGAARTAAKAEPAPVALTGVGVAPTRDGVTVGLSMRF